MGEAETLTCHTTNRDGYWEYKIDLKICADCSTRHLCTHSKDCAKTVQRSVPGIQPGEDLICCHESEKAGKLELEGLHFPADTHLFFPKLQQNPRFRRMKAGVL